MSAIFELGKILQSVCSNDTSYTMKEFVKNHYERAYYSEQTTFFDNVLYAAECLELLSMDNGRISLSKNGHEFVAMMTRSGGNVLLNGNDRQKHLLLRCIGTRCMVEVCSAMFHKFSINYSSNPPVWNSYMHVFDEKAAFIMEILEEVGMIYRKNNLLTVNNRYMDLFSAVKNKALGINMDWMHLAERRKHVGDRGEEIALEYECKRLASHGMKDLADMVEQSSLIDPYAGYDIRSFDGSDSVEHDRFIEVKGTVGTRPGFFWSKNEADRAQQYGDRYWIYLWTDIESKAKKLHMIQNPYRELFTTGDPLPEPADYKVGEKVLSHARILTDDVM